MAELPGGIPLKDILFKARKVLIPGRSQAAGGNQSAESGGDGLERYRQLPTYRRLKEGIIGSGRNYAESGLPADGLTFGELVDTGRLYIQCADGKNDHLRHVIGEIIATQIPPEERSRAAALRDAILTDAPEETVRANDTYGRHIDLQQVLDDGNGIISQYPGGITLNRQDSSEPASFFFRLTNRQRYDKGKTYIPRILTEIGLPAESNIL